MYPRGPFEGGVEEVTEGDCIQVLLAYEVEVVVQGDTLGREHTLRQFAGLLPVEGGQGVEEVNLLKINAL